MKFSEKTQTFIMTLNNNHAFHDLACMLFSDLDKFSQSIADMVICRRLKLEGRWSEYEVSDINVIYEEDVFKIFDLLQMYGLINELPQLESSDVALICTYRCSLYDFYRREIDTVNLFHITVRDMKNRKKPVNEWFILHDYEN